MLNMTFRYWHLSHASIAHYSHCLSRTSSPPNTGFIIPEEGEGVPLAVAVGRHHPLAEEVGALRLAEVAGHPHLPCR